MGDTPYEWLHRLGSGSSGEVWAARTSDGRTVAVKVLHKRSEPRHEEAIRREMTLGPMLLGHRGVVAIEHVQNVGGVLHLEMEWVKGPNLTQVLWAWQNRHGAPLPASFAIPWAVQVLETLQWAANRVAPGRPQTFVHRDVKPANLLLDPTGHVRLTDFGIARAESELGFQTTETGIVKGSPRFMAPELIRGAAVDWRTDQFSLGAVLYELVSGLPLYTGRDVRDVVMRAVQCRNGAALEALDASPALVAALRRMLSKDPDQRFPDQHAAADALAACPKPGPPLKDHLAELLSTVPHASPAGPAELSDAPQPGLDDSDIDFSTREIGFEVRDPGGAPPPDEGQVTRDLSAPDQAAHTREIHSKSVFDAETAPLSKNLRAEYATDGPTVMAKRLAALQTNPGDQEETALSSMRELLEVQSQMADETTALLPDPALGEVPVPIRNEDWRAADAAVHDLSGSDTVELPRPAGEGGVPSWIWILIGVGLAAVVLFVLVLTIATVTTLMLS